MTSQAKKNAVNQNGSDSVSNFPFTTYEDKSVDLSVIKDVMSMYQKSLLEKKNMLQEEEQKLNVLQRQLYLMIDSCRNLMRRERDFSVIFRHNPSDAEIDRCQKQRSDFKDDIERSPELVNLIDEVETIKAEIFSLKHGKNLKRAVESSLAELKKLQLMSDNITELLKLMNPGERSSNTNGSLSMPIYDEITPNCNNKITRRKNDSNHKNLKNTKSSAASNKKEIITNPKNYPQLFLEKSIVFSGTTRATASTESISDKKHKNPNISFIPKKRSDISIRFEYYRKQ